MVEHGPLEAVIEVINVCRKGTIPLDKMLQLAWLEKVEDYLLLNNPGLLLYIAANYLQASPRPCEEKLVKYAQHAAKWDIPVAYSILAALANVLGARHNVTRAAQYLSRAAELYIFPLACHQLRIDSGVMPKRKCSLRVYTMSGWVSVRTCRRPSTGLSKQHSRIIRPLIPCWPSVINEAGE